MNNRIECLDRKRTRSTHLVNVEKNLLRFRCIGNSEKNRQQIPKRIKPMSDSPKRHVGEIVRPLPDKRHLMTVMNLIIFMLEEGKRAIFVVINPEKVIDLLFAQFRFLQIEVT